MLSQVPEIGPATVELLRNCRVVSFLPDGAEIATNGITTTFGLIGVYLSLKNDLDQETGVPREVGPVEHADKFYHWW